jgi:hypothetical protein
VSFVQPVGALDCWNSIFVPDGKPLLAICVVIALSDALSAAMRASRSVATAEATAPFRTRLDPDQPEFGGKRKS